LPVNRSNRCSLICPSITNPENFRRPCHNCAGSVPAFRNASGLNSMIARDQSICWNKRSAPSSTNFRRDGRALRLTCNVAVAIVREEGHDPEADAPSAELHHTNGFLNGPLRIFDLL
jgi:hypothetical protein